MKNCDGGWVDERLKDLILSQRLKDLILSQRLKDLILYEDLKNVGGCINRHSFLMFS